MNNNNNKISQYIGKKFLNNRGEEYTVIDYKKEEGYLIEFETGNIKIVKNASNFKSGKIYDPFFPSVYGEGIIGMRYADRNSTSYKMWHNMLQRALSENYKQQYPTYYNVTVCEEWLTYRNFKSWVENYFLYLSCIAGWKEISWCLDKDLLSDDDNKIYSPKTCTFLPNELNVELSRTVRNKERLLEIADKYKNYLEIRAYNKIVELCKN